MKTKTHTIELNEVGLKIIKNSLEYLFINSEEANICMNCQKRIFKLINTFTKLVEGKTLIEKMKEDKKILCN